MGVIVIEGVTDGVTVGVGVSVVGGVTVGVTVGVGVSVTLGSQSHLSNSHISSITTLVVIPT